jgi:hypothetical protein
MGTWKKYFKIKTRMKNEANIMHLLLKAVIKFSFTFLSSSVSGF